MKRARVEWLCRRGSRELDLMLMGFLEAAYDRAEPAEQAAFQRLIEESDDTIWGYLRGQSSPTDRALAGILPKIAPATAPRP